MIFVHEGLPRSGKSYEAMAVHVLAAVKAGRPCVVALDGVNVAKLAELSGKPVAEVEALVTVLSYEQAAHVETVEVENALYVLDEVQNIWPNGRTELNPALRRFITEHGHHGRDILLLTQDLRNVHPFWRRLVQRKFLFVKLSAVGSEKRYSCTVFEYFSPDKPTRVNTVVKQYDPQFFGLYKSHATDTAQTGNYKDKRASFLAAYKRTGPLAIGALVFGAFYVWHFFHGGFAGAVEGHPVAGPVAVAPASRPGAVARASGAVAAKPSAPLDLVQAAFQQWRPRLEMVMRMGGRVQGLVAWYSSDGTRREQAFTFSQLERLGYSVRVDNGLAWIDGAGRHYVVDSWPVDPFGRVPEQRQQVIAGHRA